VGATGTVWARAAEAEGGHTRRGRSAWLQAPHGDWFITVDAYRKRRPLLRARVPFVNHAAFRFHLFRAYLLSDLGRWFLGIQDLDYPGDPLFNAAFVLQANQVTALHALLDSSELRARLLDGGVIRVVVDAAGPDYPLGVDMLRCEVAGAGADADRLRGLIALTRLVLEGLGLPAGGRSGDHGLLLADLAGPGGTVDEENVPRWCGELTRRRAAAELGALGDARAVAPLLAALRDHDAVVRGRAARSLAWVLDPAAASVLLGLLGDPTFAEGEPVREHAAAALVHLGREEWVQAYRAAIAGNAAALANSHGAARGGFMQALRLQLALGNPLEAPAAARVLAFLGARETTRDIIRARRRLYHHQEATRQLDACLDALGRPDALPRAAEPPAPDPLALPRAAPDPPPVDPARLPRAAGE
jgi:hypothetical protein